MRKLVQLFAALTIASIPVSVQAVGLTDLATDFETLMNGVARDVTPTLSMTALSGDIIGQSTINGFTFAIGTGVAITPGIATVMAGPLDQWQFTLALPKLIEQIVGSETNETVKAVEGFMPYPTAKLALGIGFGEGWDATVSGYILSQDWVTALVSSDPTLSVLAPQVNAGSLGVKVRKTLIADQGPLIPGFSIGLGYNYTALSVAANVDIDALTDEPVEIAAGQNLGLKGPMSFTASSHNIFLDLHLSKKWVILTLFNKLSGVFSASHFDGKIDFDATLGNIASQKITANPIIDLSNVSALYTAGFELDFFVVALNASIALDLGHAELNISDLSLTGIKGKGVSINAGLRFKSPDPIPETSEAPAAPTAPASN